MISPRMMTGWLARAVVIALTAAAGFLIGYAIGANVMAGLAFAVFSVFALLPYALVMGSKA